MFAESVIPPDTLIASTTVGSNEDCLLLLLIKLPVKVYRPGLSTSPINVTLIGLSLSDGKEEEINLNKVTARIKKLGYELSDFVDTVRLPLRVNQ